MLLLFLEVMDEKFKAMKTNFKRIRENTEYTQTQVAAMLGMTLGNYQKYEYGTIKSYRHDVIAKFCQIFKCEPNDLFTFEENKAA